jgi:hypothetical protein
MAKKTMSDTNEKLSYTLGALFTVVALVSFIELFFAIFNFSKTRIFKASYIYLVSIYGFTQSMSFFLFVSFVYIYLLFSTSVRMVYFFLIPSNDFKSSVVTDYVLVVLPTFLYFTGFSTIIITWYCIGHIVIFQLPSLLTFLFAGLWCLAVRRQEKLPWQPT